jgi:hypothetical protein
MGRSSSTPALRSAGASFLLSHIPKRACQHGIYLPAYEVLPTQLKPGQKSLDRQLYSEEAKDHEETYMETDIEKGSVYQRSIAGLVEPRDYYFPQKPIRQSQPKDGGGHHGTAHWKSEYRSNVNDAARFDTVLYRQNGPSCQVANPPTCVGGGETLSSYHEGFGKYGSNPRDKFGPQADKLITFKTALTVGTTKGTAHIPGYQGFLATNTSNPRVAEIANGGSMRTVDKANLTEAYHTNVVGYAGHKPLNACNDRGGVSRTNLTTHGRSFLPPSLKDMQEA